MRYNKRTYMSLQVFRCFFFVFVSCSKKKEEPLTNITNKNNKQLGDFDIRGSYTENPGDLRSLTHIKDDGDNGNTRDKLVCLGTISEIEWNCPNYSLEDLNKLFPDFIVGKTINLNDLKYIRFFLKENLKIEYEFKLEYKKSKPQKAKVILQEVANQKYAIVKITIEGNEVLTKEDILNIISPVATPLNLSEKIKFIFFKQSGAVVNPENLNQSIEHFMRILAQRKLLLDLRTAVSFIKDEKNKTIHVTIKVDEGTKYFIRKILFPKDVTIHTRHFRTWMEKHGLQDGSFHHVKTFFKDYNIFKLTASYSVDNIFLDLNVHPIDEENGIVISMIRYHGFNSISMHYIIKNIPVRIGENFNQEKIEKYIEKQSQILSTKITYKTYHLDGKFIIYLTMEDKAEEQNIISTEKNNPVIQYKFHKRFPRHPNWSLTIIPKGKIDIFNTRLNPGLAGKLTHKAYDVSCDVLSGSFFSNIESFDLRSFNFQFLSFRKINTTYLSWHFVPLVLTKYYNPLATKEIAEYIYKHSVFDGRKLDIFGEGNRRIKLSNGISAYYFFGRNLKINWNPELLYPITKYLHIQTSLKCAANTKSPDITNQETFLHLEMINAKDKVNGFLWSNHHTNLPVNIENYVNTKGIILSHFVLNFRFMINYVIFKMKFPGFGTIQLVVFIFYNQVYDFSNELHRNSAGCGLMGAYNRSCAYLSLGKKFTEQGAVNKEGLDYGLSFDHYSFQQ